MAQTQTETKSSRLLQEPKFWTRYSPHHELPLSAVTSFFAHVLALGAIALVLTGAIGSLFGQRSRQPDVTIIGVEGPAGGSAGEGSPAPRAEAVSPSQPATSVTPARANETPALQPPQVNRPKEDEQGRPQFDSEAETAKARSMLTILGKGPPSSKENRGKPLPEGDQRPPGPDIERLKPQPRINRWVLIFSTDSGQDYAKQLADLGAILAVPKDEAQTEFVVYRDLRKTPVRGQVEDLSKIERICWIDDKPESVKSICGYLGIAPVPKLLVAYFPVELQDELRSRERKAFNGDEREIEKTQFEVKKDPRGKYTPVVKNVVRRK